ncbi:MAG: ChbG/HpnK family deacetylase, partial [Megasphaera micronuciformis]|nr:ChbG/HpnK family deacetylase [Megasphaera micronuciformis]
DDFGIHEAVNEGIYSAYGQGVLTSTSLLAQGPAFDDAVRMSKECNRLGIGIHLCLVGSLPTVLSPREVPSLVESDGLLPDNYMTFIKRVYTGKIDFSQVYAELSAQIEKILDSGIRVTHIDSHQHLHVLPPVWKITVALMKKYGIHRVRIPREASTFKMLTASPARVFGRDGLTVLAGRAAREAERLGFSLTDYFWGMVDGGNMTEVNLQYILRRLPFGIHEIMMHPGKSDDLLGHTFAWGYHWQEELQALVSVRTREIIASKKIELINYGDLL